MKVKVVTIGLLVLLGYTPLVTNASANESIEYFYQNNGWEYVGDIKVYCIYNGSWHYSEASLYVKVIQQKTFYQIKIDDKTYAVVLNDDRKYSGGYADYQYKAGDYYLNIN